MLLHHSETEERMIAFGNLRQYAIRQLRLQPSTPDADIMIAVLEQGGRKLHVTEDGVI